MKKLFALIGVVSLLTLGFVLDSNATESMAPKGGSASEVINLIGNQVQTPDGEVVGTITDFVFDSSGQSVFAILYQGDREDFDFARHVAVPFRLLSITENEPALPTVIVNVDKEVLFAAPAYDRNTEMSWSDWGQDVYRYYGLQPYWTMEESGKEAPTMGEAETY
jgi:sporulation protein YlmC with PRC-barrel domain